MTEGLAYEPPDETPGPVGLYLDLLKRTLTGMVYEDPPIPVSWLGYEDYRLHERATGYDWPQHAPCMIGTTRLDNVQECAEHILADNIPGDFAEAGVWRAGTAIFMRALLAVHGDTTRDVWVIDSFNGLPRDQAAAENWAEDSLDPIAVPLPEVKHNFALYGLLDDRVRFLPGWFADTLPAAPISRLSLLRLDADLYTSQRDALTHLYPKLSPGGYCIIDDPQMEGCARAIAEYRHQHEITAPIKTAGPWCLYWRKD